MPTTLPLPNASALLAFCAIFIVHTVDKKPLAGTHPEGHPTDEDLSCSLHTQLRRPGSCCLSVSESWTRTGAEG